MPNAAQRAQAEQSGERLRAWREGRGWTQAELARRSGLSPTTLSQYETGRVEPTFAALRRLAHAYGRATVDLLIAIGDLTEEDLRPPGLTADEGATVGALRDLVAGDDTLTALVAKAHTSPWWPTAAVGLRAHLRAVARVVLGADGVAGGDDDAG